MSSGFRARRLAVLVAATVLTAGCGSGGQAPAAPGSAAASAVPSAGAAATAADGTDTPDAGPGAADGTLAAPDKATNAFTYNPALAPEGADLSVDVETAAGTTEVALDVDGLLPNRGYAAHAHVNPCGATGDAAGPHFQNQVDPAAAPGKPSTDPAYANPQNEIWLDLHTDGEGSGEATATVPFLLTDRAPGVDRDPRGPDDRDGARPGRLRGCPHRLHHGAVQEVITAWRCSRPRP